MKVEGQRLTCGEIILQKKNKYDLLYRCSFCEQELDYVYDFIRHMLQHLDLSKTDAEALTGEVAEINAEEVNTQLLSDEIIENDADYYEEICIEVDQGFENASEASSVKEQALMKQEESAEDNFLEGDYDENESFVCDEEVSVEAEFNIVQMSEDEEDTQADTVIEEAFENSPTSNELPEQIKSELDYAEISHRCEKKETDNEKKMPQNTPKSKRQRSTRTTKSKTVDSDSDWVGEGEEISSSVNVKRKRAPKKFVDLNAITNPKRGKVPKIREVKSHVDRKYTQKTVKGKKMLTCDFCDALFTNASNLKVHHYRHLGIKPHNCPYCEKSFATTTDLKTHIFFHTGERPFVCEDCGLKYRDSAHLKDHRRRHVNDRPHSCSLCGKRFYDKNRLREHSICHTNDRPFECEECGSTFQRRKALVQHQKLHSNTKQYECKICGKAFAQNAGLYSHMKHHAR